MSRAASSADPSPHPVDAVPREALPFQGQRAGIVTRTAANVVDFTVVVLALACGYAAWCAFRFLINPTQFRFPRMPFLALLVCFGIVLFVYFTTSWAMTGRTYGNHLLGLRVVNFRGERLRWPGAMVRAGFCIALPVGLYWAVFSPTNRSVQDSVLRTSVIYDWTTRRRTTPHPVAEPGGSLVLPPPPPADDDAEGDGPGPVAQRRTGRAGHGHESAETPVQPFGAGLAFLI